MLGMVSIYKRSEHTFIGGELGEYIKKFAEESGRPLFLIRYNKLGVFCICEWMSPNKDIFVDVMNLDKSLGNFTRTMADELRHRLFAPVSCAETSKAIASAESDYYHMRQDENSEEWDRQARVLSGE
jgi:hypothetical protein